MNPINRIAGLILGAITGASLALLEIPYAYYIFAKNRRAAGYSWPATLLATATIGNLFALATGILSITSTLILIGAGMKVGWAKGIIGAITLPYLFHTEFQKSLAASERTPTLFSQIGDLMLIGFQYLDSDAQGNIKSLVSPSLIAENASLRAEYAALLMRQAEAEYAALLMQQREEIIEALNAQRNNIGQQLQVPNRALLEKIDALAANEKQDVRLLTEAEIEEYKKAIQNLPEEERAKKEKSLADYNDSITCSITTDIPNTPITVVLSSASEGKSEISRTYDSNALKEWIKTKGENATEPTSRRPLKDLAIYRGYSSQIINFVNEVRKANKKLSQAKKTPAGILAQSTLFCRGTPKPTQAKANTNDVAPTIKKSG